MLTQTSVTAVQALLYLALAERNKPVSPAEIARKLDASATYVSKINTQLVKANILQSHRGKHGGVVLARSPDSITLLEVVEACQGRILADYCAAHDDPRQTCGFHGAMHQLQAAVVETLRAWSLKDLARKPLPDASIREHVSCRMACAYPTKTG